MSFKPIRRVIPGWIVAHPRFRDELHTLVKTRLPCQEAEFSFEHWEEFNELAHIAADRVRQQPPPADNDNFRLCWSLSYLRGFAHQRAALCSRALAAYPQLEEMFNPILGIGSLTLLGQHVNSLVLKVAEQQANANEVAPCSEQRKTNCRNGLFRRMAQFNPKKKRTREPPIAVHEVSDAPDVNDSINAIRNHWGPVFKESISPFRDESDFLGRTPPFDDVQSWQVDDELIQPALDKFHDSSPGPDGIPYSLYKLKLPLLRRWIFLFIHMVFDTRTLYDNANHGLTFLLNWMKSP